MNARRGRLVAPRAALVGAALTLLLTACAPEGAGQPAPSATASKPAPDDETPSPGSFEPDASVEENLRFFDHVNRQSIGDDSIPGGQVVIDGLRAHGLGVEALEVTPDTTPDGHRADAVQFAARLGDRCLLGQVSEQGYSSAVAPVLAGGNCLVGVTRAIDW
ncbi:DUF6993 domain-containing protein [Ruicaihuangia caeni]|uniref:DUF6993 domain-containing protein n=1 Tax=Ruicaihuangia caeni TaxID=3042517 RepID=UPI00338F8763